MIRVRSAEERVPHRLGLARQPAYLLVRRVPNPAQMGFRTLRVINDDRVKAGAGFGTHGHVDRKILSYVLEGALEHKNSSGGGVIRPGDIQFMRAGTGVTHSEYNHSKVEPVHFLQIWIMPDARGLKPTYGQIPFDRDAAKRSFVLLASRDGREGSLQVHQDVGLWVTLIGAGERREFRLRHGRHAWIHVARGSVSVNGTVLHEGDGAAVSEEDSLVLLGQQPAEVLVFDLA